MKFVEAALYGGIVVNIGQIDKFEVREFNRLAKSGILVRWRGYWHPITGASWGIGPLKTCWALPAYVPRQANAMAAPTIEKRP